MARRRALIIMLYWLVQAALLYTLWPAVFDGDFPRVNAGDVWERLTDAGYAWRSGLLILGLTAMQAAFVRPVARPGLRRASGTGTSVLRQVCGVLDHSASAMALSFAGALAALLAVVVLKGWDLVEFGPVVLNSEELILFGGMGVGTAVLTPVLMWVCRHSTPVWLSLAIAGLAICALITALVMAGLEAVEQIWRVDVSEDLWRWAGFLPLLLGWPVTTPLLIAFVRRGPRESRLSRVASMIFLGTVIETAAVSPLDILVRRRSNCYCEQGTFWSLTLLGSVGLFALGPAIYLLPFGRRRRRWLEGRCEVCGYDMKATAKAERCPECGAGWKARPSTDMKPGR